MSLARRPLLAFAGLALLPFARRASAAVTLVKGSGVAATQRRDIGAFTGIGLGGPFAVVLRAGSREAIEVVADANIVPLVRTQLKGGGDRSLQIDLPPETRVEPVTPIVVTIDYVRLDHLAVGGSGSISAKAMKTAKLETSLGGSGTIDLAELEVDKLGVAIGGSGTVRADGRSRALSASIGGSGRCDTERLIADDVSVVVAGSGEARVRAETALRASIAGSGEVHHSGAAVPQVAIVGSGRIKRI
ncbi:MAG TPA: head GIN domain-containing protein [Caldimonas sp.]|nr:head GIN domain-containing protein [Caldimonas sp.]